MQGRLGIGIEHVSLTHPWVLDQLAALNQSAAVVIAPGMSTSELELLHRLARRFHILSTRLDYARALALNGFPDAAEAELRIIRSVYPAFRFARIEREWKAWREQNVSAMSSGENQEVR